jgi:hypothetical protein
MQAIREFHVIYGNDAQAPVFNIIQLGRKGAPACRPAGFAFTPIGQAAEASGLLPKLQPASSKLPM